MDEIRKVPQLWCVMFQCCGMHRRSFTTKKIRQNLNKLTDINVAGTYSVLQSWLLPLLCHCLTLQLVQRHTPSAWYLEHTMRYRTKNTVVQLKKAENPGIIPCALIRTNVGGPCINAVFHQFFDSSGQSQNHLPWTDLMHWVLVDGLDGPGRFRAAEKVTSIQWQWCASGIFPSAVFM